MLKKDSLAAQMQQLSNILAKAKRLILEDLEADARIILKSAVEDYFQLGEEQIIHMSEEQLRAFLLKKAFRAEEIDLLCDFMDELAGTQETQADQIAIYKKQLALYDFLSQHFGYLSFTHLSRKSILQEQLK